ncbi:MAG: polysaccharide pyruvyl transferase family protein [Clostridia bacterium]|nr:polysaccharide pyruvyl transferase family protein [Clostridia bacterium]
MKKKVGIMSMQRIINYGSFLQAFALSHIVKNLGHEVEFVDFKIEPCIIEKENKLSLESIDKNYEKEFIMYKEFENTFKTKFLPELGINNRNERPTLDTLIIGSDEVFNCFQPNSDVGYSLELFGKDNNAKKVISYAASCGSTTFEKALKFNKHDEISSFLNKFHSISVRDNNSFNFTKKLSNIDPIKHFDPALIYDFSNDVIDNVNIDNYILLYAYSFELSDADCQKIKEFAKKHNKKIVTIGSYQKCTDIFIPAHPLEVLPYFKKADFVITDTFHGTIFSVKAHVPFVTKLKTYNTEKLSYLLESLKFANREILSYDELENLYNTKIDFDECDKLIENEKIRTLEYLKENI